VFECGVSARVGSVLCQCIHILGYKVPASVIGGLVQGVSGRIEKSEVWMRREGMIVGEALARCTGNEGGGEDGERMFEEVRRGDDEARRRRGDDDERTTRGRRDDRISASVLTPPSAVGRLQGLYGVGGNVRRGS
jgi:hypothetical protein